MKRTFIIAFNIFLCIFALQACSRPDVSSAYVPVELIVEEVNPSSGPFGTVVEIKGEGFSRDASKMKVLFDNRTADILAVEESSLYVVAPEHEMGEVTVYVLKDNVGVKAKFTYTKPDLYPEYPQTSVGKDFEKSCTKVSDVIWDTTYMVYPGLQFTELTLLTDANELQQIHLLKVEPDKGLSMKVCMPNNSSDISAGWKKQTLTGMTGALKKAGQEVVAMINADFWNMTAPINPRGPVHMDGKTISSEWDYEQRVSQQALSFAGIMNDGSPLIDYREKYEGAKDKLTECTGGGVVMLKDGKEPEISYFARDPRTAVGYTSDGIWWLLTAAGRGYDKASGVTYQEMGAMFKTLGCTDAVNLDGGGSAQMLIREPLSGNHVIINNPTDGKERAVINGWAVIKKK